MAAGYNFADWLDIDEQVHMPSLTGDFYPELDDVTRGLSLPSRGKDACKIESFTEFEEHLEAPAIPKDAFFHLAPTTVMVKASSAAQVGNCMLDFFAHKVAGLITKVSSIKFTVKAECFLDGFICETKVRIYQESIDQYLVEMQRRSGDSIAFQRLYQGASQHLLAYVAGCTPTSLEKLVTPPPVLLGDSTEIFLTPLFDLAETSNVQLQTEAIQGLLLAAAVQLCTTEAFLALRSALQSNSKVDGSTCRVCSRCFSSIEQCNHPQLAQVFAKADPFQTFAS